MCFPVELSGAPQTERPGSLASPRAPIAGVASDASTAAALEEMSNTLVRARSEGHMVVRIPLGQIDLNHLVRDRIAIDDTEMEALVASLRARGQQTPIEVVELNGNRYGLISGWRRCHALKQLHAEGHGDGTALALLRQPDGAAEAYLAMVEENEIRVGLSYFERARIVDRALEQGVFETEKSALQGLFGAASRAKRSKIKSFLTVVRALDGVLTYPAQIGERLGLQLSRRLTEEPAFSAALSAALKAAAPLDAAKEQAILEQVLSGRPASAPTPKVAHQDHSLGQGVAARVHQDGRFELRGRPLPASVRDELIQWLEGKLGGGAETP